MFFCCSCFCIEELQREAHRIIVHLTNNTRKSFENPFREGLDDATTSTFAFSVIDSCFAKSENHNQLSSCLQFKSLL